MEVEVTQDTAVVAAAVTEEVVDPPVDQAVRAAELLVQLAIRPVEVVDLVVHPVQAVGVAAIVVAPVVDPVVDLVAAPVVDPQGDLPADHPTKDAGRNLSFS